MSRSTTNGWTISAAPEAVNRRRPATRAGTPAVPTAARWVRALSVLNLLGVLGVLGLLYIVAETWWPGVLVTYLPRSPYLLPAVVLGGCSLKWHPRSLWANCLAAGIVLGPIMELHVPVTPLISGDTAEGSRLNVVSANVQQFRPDFPELLQDIFRMHPDVLALQEARGMHPLLERSSADWHTIHVGEFWVGSKYPLRLVGRCECPVFGRTTAVAVEIEGPDGPFVLCNVHQMTAQRGLVDEDVRSLLFASGGERVERHARRRGDEATLTRAFVAGVRPGVPRLIVGDFNMPASSSLYRANWSGFTNAFQAAGCGFGYTAPCRAIRFWPDEVPWLRVDHVLVDDRWTVERCRVGDGGGSDHRPVAASVRLRKRNSPAGSRAPAE